MADTELPGPGPRVRRIALDYPADLDPAWIPSRPEFACAANSVSLLMPYMEPYFVRSVAAVQGDLDGPLAARTRAYLGQETQHHRQHQRFNRILVDRYPGLGWIESLADRTYRWLDRSRSARFNLAFAAASETIAYSAARWSAERRQELFADADPVVSSLFLWHLAEEVEHKSVAWDVYVAADGSRGRYARAFALSVLLVMLFVGAGTAVMLWSERRWYRPTVWLRLAWWAITFAFELLPNAAVALLPGHHPDQLADPSWYELWLRHHDTETGTVPVWTEVSPVGIKEDGMASARR